jgi:hypothetical protein
MPLFDMFAWDIERAPYEHLDPICSAFWRAYARGELTDDEAQSLAELARDRQRPKPPPKPLPPRQPRRPPRSPDRQRSLERRRCPYSGLGPLKLRALILALGKPPIISNIAGYRSLHESQEFRAFLLTLISLPLFCA